MKRIAILTRYVLIALIAVVAFFLAGVSFSDEVLSDDERRLKIQSMYEKYKKKFPEVNDISPEDAMALMKKTSVVFVDIRHPGEQAISMLPGAITDRLFLRNPDAYRDKTIIGYCTISFRSGKFAKKLKRKGIEMINLRGGMLAWLHAGGEVYKDGRPVRSVHVYGKKWDLAPTGYDSVF